MKKPSVVLLLIPLITIASAGERDSKNAEDLVSLLREIQRILPATWDARISPSAAEPWGVGAPTLVIHTKHPVLIARHIPNSRDGKPKVEHKIVSISYETREYISPREYTDARRRNADRKKERMTFVAARLRNVDGGHKGERPIPPDAYFPKTEDQKRAVIEYAFLWMRTMPEALPSHHFKELAFEQLLAPSGTARMDDPKIGVQYREIVTQLDAILNPYTAP